jgi:hypothetical protein
MKEADDVQVAQDVVIGQMADVKFHDYNLLVEY